MEEPTWEHVSISRSLEDKNYKTPEEDVTRKCPPFQGEGSWCEKHYDAPRHWMLPNHHHKRLTLPEGSYRSAYAPLPLKEELNKA